MIPFTDAEVGLIQARYAREGALPLAQELGRTRKQIGVKARALGLSYQPHKASTHTRNWTPEEDGMIRAEWPAIQRHVLGKTAVRLAKRMGVDVQVLRRRAAALGVRALYQKTPDWVEEEIEILARSYHLSTSRVRAKLSQAGFTRSDSAIALKRARLGFYVHTADETYTTQGLAALMGVSARLVGVWIKRDWLKATPRTEALDPNHGGVGDRWMIKPKDVRALIRDYTEHVDITCADKHWLVDLLAGPRRATIQHTAGRGAAEMDEMRIAA